MGKTTQFSFLVIQFFPTYPENHNTKIIQMFSRFLPRKSVVWETFFWKLLQPKSCYRSGLLNPPNVINVVIKNVKNVVTKNVPQFIYKTHRKSHESHFYYSCRLGGLQLNQRRDPSTGIFLWILGYFWEHHFSRTLSGNSFYRYYLKHQIVGFFFFLLTIPMFIYWSFISLGLCVFVLLISNDYDHTNTFWLLQFLQMFVTE